MKALIELDTFSYSLCVDKINPVFVFYNWTWKQIFRDYVKISFGQSAVPGTTTFTKTKDLKLRWCYPKKTDICNVTLAVNCLKNSQLFIMRSLKNNQDIEEAFSIFYM